MQISINFGQSDFKFDIDRYLIDEANKTFDSINKADVSKKCVFDVVSFYLYLNGHHGALVSLEASKAAERSPTIQNFQRTSVLAPTSLNSHSSRVCTPLQRSPDSEDKKAVMLGKEKSFFSALKKLFIKPSTSNEEMWEDYQESSPTLMQPGAELSDDTAFLERSMIRKGLIKGKLEEVRNLLCQISPRMYSNHLGIQAMFLSLEFLSIFKSDSMKSLVFAKEHFTSQLQSQKVQYIDSSKKVQYFELKVKLDANQGTDEIVRSEGCQNIQVCTSVREVFRPLLRRSAEQLHSV